MAQLRDRWADADVRLVDSLAALVDDDSWFPDIGVICQSWSDEFSRSDVLRLFDAFPLTRWICAHGPWCDSDGRNRAIWPEAFRVPDAWIDLRLDREARVLNNSLSPLSATASPAEIFGYHYRAVEPVSVSRPVAVMSPDRPYRLSVIRVLEEAGHAIVDDVATCAAILWDCDPWIPLHRERLRRLNSSEAPIVGLVGLPLPDDEAEMRTDGIDIVVPKLAPAEKLLAVIEAVTASRAVRRA